MSKKVIVLLIGYTKTEQKQAVGQQQRCSSEDISRRNDYTFLWAESRCLIYYIRDLRRDCYQLGLFHHVVHPKDFWAHFRTGATATASVRINDDLCHLHSPLPGSCSPATQLRSGSYNPLRLLAAAFTETVQTFFGKRDIRGNGILAVKAGETEVLLFQASSLNQPL